jgi:hypothetical protein
VSCKLCKPEVKELVYDGSTGNMNNHLKTYHTREYFALDEQVVEKEGSSKPIQPKVILDPFITRIDRHFAPYF